MLPKFCSFVLIISSFSIRAQIPLRSGNSVDTVIDYLTPVDGDTFVSARTTLIVRPSFFIIGGHSANDFLFEVNGEKSGYHEGELIISDDKRTLIFKPDFPYQLDELINVKISFLWTKSISPLFYHFRITPISDSAECSMLNLLKVKEKQERTAFQKSHEEIQGVHLSPYFPLDTLPKRFPLIVIDSLDAANVAPGNVFISPTGSNCIIIIDNAGNPQFVREIPGIGVEDFKMETGNKLSFFKLDTVIALGNLFQGVHYLLNDHYQLIDSFRCGNGYHTDDHDFRLLPNGHALVMAYDARKMNMRTVTGDSNAAKNATVIGCIIQELDAQKNVIKEWKTWDHLQITDISNFDLTDPNHTVIDYAHLNSIEMDTDGNVIASFRSMDDVVKIQWNDTGKNFGKVLWRWGGKNKSINYFTFAGDTLPFSGQHDVRRIANGHITMWDNGNFRKTLWSDGSIHDTSFSRAIEYDLDENSLIATSIWEYRDLPYSFASGNVQRLTNGNTFIGLGAQNKPNAIEVTPAGKKVFQLSIPNDPYNYRAFRYEWPPKALINSAPGGDNYFRIYPNPAVNSTSISFSADAAEEVQLTIIDILGNNLLNVNKRIQHSGEYSIPIDISRFQQGSYFCKLTQNGSIHAQMLIIQR